MKLFSHASSIFPVANPPTTAEYYRDVLKFTIPFLWENPSSYAVINRKEAINRHLVKSEDSQSASTHPKLYIFVNDPDLVHEEYQKSKANIIEPINDTDYKMREFVIEDINGYKLVIEKGI